MPAKYVPVFVLLSSLVLYIAGVATGWFIGQTYYHSTEEKLSQLEMQMKDLRSLPSADLCSYAEARYYLLLSSLKYFDLPYRLESASVPAEILDRYMQVESEAYVTGQILASSCQTKPKLILYFFERGETNSMKAGKILDSAKGEFVVLAFPVDTNSSTVESLTKYFGITDYPSLVICDQILDWPFTAEDVQEAEMKCK